jgi:hypothetical protein
MAKKIGIASISTGEYEKDGEKKKRWLNIGVVFEDERGNISIKFEVLPVMTADKVGYGAAWVKIFMDDNKQDAPPAYKPPPKRPAACTDPHSLAKANAYQPDRFTESDQPEDDGKIPF